MIKMLTVHRKRHYPIETLGIWRQSTTSSRDALSAIAMRFIDKYFSLFAREDDDVRNVGKRTFVLSTSPYVILC